MSQPSRLVDWDKIRTEIEGLGITVLPYEKCDRGDLLDSGSVMNVYTGTCFFNSSPIPVAFKEHRRIKTQGLRQREVDAILDQLKKEVKLMKRLESHPNIVQVLGVTFMERRPVLVVELANCTLEHYLDDKLQDGGPPVGWIEKARLSLDVLVGLKGLHNAGVVHGDLKGANILVFVTASAGIPTAKISDFGFASTFTSNQSSVGGTRHFMAPECTGNHPDLMSWKKKPTIDIYGFGMVTFQIVVNGARPYDDVDDGVLEVKDADRDLARLLSYFPPEAPAEFRTVIVKTAKFLPQDRASLDQVESILQNLLMTLLPQTPASNLDLPLVINERVLRLTKDIANPVKVDLGGHILTDEDVNALAEFLKLNKTLIELNLEGCKIDDNGACALAESLKHNTTLAQLNLTQNSIGSNGAQALAESLKQNSTLTHLNLEGRITNFFIIINQNIGLKGAMTMAESLKQNTTLIQLNLAGSEIGSEGAQALAESLKQNTTLTHLNLSRSIFHSKFNIGSEGALALAESLKQNTTLTQLNLEYNSIGLGGANALAEALKQNTTLTRLDLEGNSIGSEGAQALAETLKQNTTLTRLDLGWNSIGSEGAQALAETLKQNTTLTQLDLEHNKIGSEGAKALVNSLKQNTTLIQLNLWGNDIYSYSDEFNAIVKSLGGNRILMY